MKVNFLTDLKSDTGILVFLCFKGEPFDKYLNVSWNSELNLTINDNDRHAAEFLSVFDKGHI